MAAAVNPPLRVAVWVPGRAVAQGSMPIFSGRAVQPHALVVWREAVAGHAQVQLARLTAGWPVWPHGPIDIELRFRFAVPAGRRTYDLYARGMQVPDVDKTARAILDALQGVIYRDDAQVRRLTAEKLLARDAEEEGVQIEAWPAPLPAEALIAAAP